MMIAIVMLCSGKMFCCVLVKSVDVVVFDVAVGADEEAIVAFE